MNGRIASLLQGRISAFSYVEKISGLVRAITKVREGKEVTIPVGNDVIDDLQCDASTQRDMIPDDRYKAIVYFEDRGWRRIQHRTRGVSIESHIRLVCWLNTARLNGDAFAGDKIQQLFIGALTTGPYNDGPYVGVRHHVESSPEKGREIFSKYTYQIDTQYLMLPYDAFAIDIVTSLRVRPGCEDQVNDTDVECWTPPTTHRRFHPSEFPCEDLNDPVHGLTAEQKACIDGCGGGSSCPITFEIYLHGVLVDTITGVDPCAVDNQIDITLT